MARASLNFRFDMSDAAATVLASGLNVAKDIATGKDVKDATVSEAINQPYGREVNIIDRAGVCWHFVQQ